MMKRGAELEEELPPAGLAAQPVRYTLRPSDDLWSSQELLHLQRFLLIQEALLLAVAEFFLVIH